MKKKELESKLYDICGDVQIIVNKYYDYAAKMKTNVSNGELVEITIDYYDENNLVMLEFLFDDGSITCEDFHLDHLEVKYDLYLEGEIISLIDNSSNKSLHIQH